MSPIELAIIGIFGLWIGWLIDWIVNQMPREDHWHNPGVCPNCGEKHQNWLRWIPILRHVGREICPGCDHLYGRRGFIIELVTAVSILVIAQVFGWSWMMLWYILIVIILVPIAAIDIEFQIIPDSLLLFGLIPLAGLWITNYSSELLTFIIGGLVLGLGLLTVSIVGRWIYKQDVMGFGDVKFVAWMGLILGWKIGLVALGLGFLLATAVFLVLMPLGKVRLKQEVPFGPFLVGGMFLGMVYGRTLLDWYLNNFVYI